MPLIEKQKDQKFKTIKVSVPVELFREIEEYCSWAEIKEHSFLLTQAVEYVFSKDKEWRNKKNFNG